MKKEKSIVILFGAQASGKGSQGKFLSEYLNIPHISTGRLIRQEAAKVDSFSDKLNNLMETGQFIPDDLMLQLLKKRLGKKDAENGFILDGYPRNILQTELFEEYLKSLDNYKVFIFNLLIAPETIVKRVAGRYICSNCGRNYNIYFFPPKKDGICDVCEHKLIKRADDTEEIIKERYKIFKESTQPVIDFYRKKEHIDFFDIDGEKEILNIFNDIKKELL